MMLQAKRIRLATLGYIALFMGSLTGVAAPAEEKDAPSAYFELWQWGETEADRKLFCVVTNGAHYVDSSLPNVLSIRLRVKEPHDKLSFHFQSKDFVQRFGWGPNDIDPEKAAKGDYRVGGDRWSFAPWADHYRAEADIGLKGKTLRELKANFEIVRDLPKGRVKTWQEDVGFTNPFPPVVEQGIPVEFQLWQWEPREERKLICLVTNGSRISMTSIPTNWHLLAKAMGEHDGVTFNIRASNLFDQVGVGPQPAREWKLIDGSLYRVFADFWSVTPAPDSFFAQLDLTLDGKTVGTHHIAFSIFQPERKQGTTYLTGKKDYRGTTITSSKPVKLGSLNESPKLKDTDYPFEPQRALNVCNYERFPDFHMNSKFLLIFGTRRWEDERIYGGPLEHGFSTLATRLDSDHLATWQKVRFTYPGTLLYFCGKMIEQDPVKYADLKAWAEHRLPWMSPSNAFDLGWNCGDEAVGIWGWDEEEMGEGAAESALRERPEFLPPELQYLVTGDPTCEKPETKQLLRESFLRYWADFLGYFYKGVRARAESNGRGIKIFHYGSKVMAANNGFWLMATGAGSFDPAAGKYKTELPNSLDSWFKAGDVPNFGANEYTRQLDFFAKDFYYWTIFPENVTIYEKDKAGNYVLGDNGRRKVRSDVIEETQYADPTKIGYEDYAVSPPFMKDFINKAENTLYWLNGGRYYKQYGTLVGKQRLIPTHRRGSQNTWPGETPKLDSRPVSPYMAEANPIFTLLSGLEGFYYWDSCGNSPAAGTNGGWEGLTFGEVEYTIKGMHRLSKFNKLFDGSYQFVRPVQFADMWPYDDQTIIRGLINGRYLLLGMTNPYLDLDETQSIELWYDTPAENMSKAIWKDTVVLKPRTTHLFQCKLPALPKGQVYDPDKLYFRYTSVDGTWSNTFIVSGSYNAPYPHAGK